MAAQPYDPAPVQDFDLPRDISDAQLDAAARELVSQLSLDEKIGLMSGDTSFWPGGGYSKRTWNAGSVPRLGVPGIRFADGPRGVMFPGATTFPVSMARGASWDVELEERVGDVIGRELRTRGGTLFGGVCINLLRHPAWGRAQETYGEDTHLLGEMGAALTRGVQRHVMACAKHYALNSMENARFTVDVRIAPRPLHEVYLAHFKRVVDEGVASVMSAYNSVNGEWCGQNAALLSDILKKTWGFEGFVVTDFIFGVRDAKKAVLAGLDVEMPFEMVFRVLPDLVRSGEVPESRVDDAAFRIVRQQLRLLRKGDYPADQVGCDAHRAIAREAAQKSIVLLQNTGGLLPLSPRARLAVIGRLAAVPNTGDGGSSNTSPAHVVTPLEGLQAAMGEAVIYDDGTDVARAAEVARGADAAVIVVGYTHEDEGESIPHDLAAQFARYFPPPTEEERPIVERLMAAQSRALAGFPPGGDRDTLGLRPPDEALVRAVAAVQPRCVVAVMAGSTVLMEAWRHEVPAVLMLWYPGMEGGHALADILFGWVNPSGRLPFVVPRRAEDLPAFDKHATTFEYDLWHGHRKLERDGVEPAFPFGFGLSYTRYECRAARVDQEAVPAAGTIGVSVDVANVGERAGEQVVQVYAHVPRSAVERAPRTLVGFARVALEAGEVKTVRVEVPVSRLAYYDGQEAGFVVEPTRYELIVGGHSLDPMAARASVTVVA